VNLIEFVKRDNYCDKDQGETDEFVLFPRRLLTRSWRHIRLQLLPSSLFPGLVGKDDVIDFEKNFRKKKKKMLGRQRHHRTKTKLVFTPPPPA
jgi:hypothetical protein